MQVFAVVLSLDSIRFEIHFNEYHTPNGIRYFVFASDPGGDSFSFTMEMRATGWRIINAPLVSSLFLKNEETLSAAIIEHERKISG